MSAQSSQQQSHYAGNGAVRIHYVVAGRGPTVVLLHGIPDFWNGWRYQIGPLSTGHRVAAVDLRGFNLSDKPAGVRSFSIRELVGDVLAVLRHLDVNQVTIVGHDWGGIVGWWFAMFYPQHVHRLAILSAPHPLCYLAAVERGEQRAHLGYVQDLTDVPFGEPLDVQRLSAWVSDESARSELEAALARSDPEALRNVYRANLGPSAQAPAQVPLVTVPTLVMYGEADPHVTSLAYEHTGDYVSGELKVIAIPGAGHFLHHEAADRVSAELLRWLKQR